MSETNIEKDENIFIWGSIHPKHYKLDKPIITDKLGFYFLSEDESKIDNIIKIFQSKLDLMSGTFPIVLHLDDIFDNTKTKTFESMLTRMITVLCINQDGVNHHIRMEAFSNKIQSCTMYCMYISIKNPFPTIDDVWKTIIDDLIEKIKKEGVNGDESL